jgi:hypothetical protein
MRRERIEKKVPKPKRPLEILPLDPRDRDILRAKALPASQRPRRKSV